MAGFCAAENLVSDDVDRLLDSGVILSTISIPSNCATAISISCTWSDILCFHL